MSDRNHKSWARLRALVSNLTIAGLATAAPATATAATEPAPAADPEARGLARRLAHLPSIESMGAAAELALSPELHERQQLARPGVGRSAAREQAVIEHLASDPSPDVRAAAARAAWVRRSSTLDQRVLHRLLGDEDPEVRAAAWLAVSR
jgi:hypothetical protein